jgi:hypothetical protein
VGNPSILSCEGVFLRSSREQMRGFHDLIKQKPSSLFITLGWSSISVSSLMMRSMHLGLVDRALMLCSRMRRGKFIVSPRLTCPDVRTGYAGGFLSAWLCFLPASCWCLYLAFPSTLKMEAIYSSETSVDFQRPIRYHMLESGLFKVKVWCKDWKL